MPDQNKWEEEFEDQYAVFLLNIHGSICKDYMKSFISKVIQETKEQVEGELIERLLAHGEIIDIGNGQVGGKYLRISMDALNSLIEMEGITIKNN